MRRRPLAAGVFCLWLASVPAIWAALQPSETDQFNGQQAPDFYVETLKGEDVSLAALKGKPVLLNFFASWCPPCRAEIGELMKLRQQYAKSGLTIVGAATDSKLIPDTPPFQEKRDVEELADRLKIPYPITIANDDLTKRYHFIGIPTTIFINRKGIIEKVFYGYHEAGQFEEPLLKLFLTEKSK
jgi:thiol-disulfide isomerase/thioredoxin